MGEEYPFPRGDETNYTGGESIPSLTGYIRLIRPLNAVVAGITGIIGYIVATGSLEPANIWIFLVVFLVTAGGNAINDYFDVDIDRINRPERPIPSGKVNRAAVPVYSAAFFLSGIATSFAMNYLCVAIAALNSALLIWYAVSLKRTAGAGNAAISYLTASIFVFGAASAGAGAVVRVIPLAVVTFLAMLARELWKDAEDLEGDAAAGASTLPVRMGIKPVVQLGFVFLAGAIAASLVPALWWGLPYLTGIAVVDIAILWAALRALPCGTPGCIRQSNATALVKYAMFGSLAVFTAAALFL